nr:hypothetical protein [Legionella taurinensis]
MEIAQAYRRLGSEVTILARHTLLYQEDPLLVRNSLNVLRKKGFVF